MPARTPSHTAPAAQARTAEARTIQNRTTEGRSAPARPTRARARARAAGILSLTIASAALLSGCAGAVALDPADDATNPGCAEVIVRLPDTVADLAKRETDAQATGAWGDPASVLLRCGVQPYGPTTLPCDNVNGVDWIRDDSDAPMYRFTTFGRTPAVEVVLDSDAVSSSSTLVDLANAISSIPQTQQCLSLDDGTGTSTGTPVPIPAD